MFQPIGSVAERIVAQIEKEFGPRAEINHFKSGVRKAIALGAGHPANMARYGKRLALIRYGIAASAVQNMPLNGAIALVEHWYRHERESLAVAAALGYGNRMSLSVLRELRLMLRVLRRSEYHGHLTGLVAFSIGHALEAAE